MADDNPYAADTVERSVLVRRETSPALVWGCATVLVLLLLAATASVSFVVGAIKGQFQLYQSRAALDAEEVRAFFAQHPGKFDSIQVEATSDGIVYLVGSVSSQADLDLLREGMIRCFGEKRGTEASEPVTVDGQNLGSTEGLQ